MSGNTDFIPPHVRKKQGGYIAMTSVLLGLVLLLSFMPLLAKETGRILTGIEVKATAGQLSTVTAAVSDYVHSNHAAMAAAVTQTNGLEVSFDDLRTGGFLMSTFRATNPFGLDYRAFVFAGNQPDSLVALVVTDGLIGDSAYGSLSEQSQQLVSKTIPDVASVVGVNAGVIPAATMPGMTQGVIEGTNGIWTFDTRTLTPFAAVGQGTLATVQHFTNGTANNDYLYRNEVPGQPELNEMNTHLSLGNHDIENIRNIVDMTGYLHSEGDQLNDGNVFEAERGNMTLNDGTYFGGDVVISDVEMGGNPVPLSRAVLFQQRINSGGTLPKPTCPAGSTPQPFATPDNFPVSATNGVQTTSGLQSGDLLANRVRAVNNGTSWRIYIDSNIRQGGTNTWYPLATTEGSLVANSKCI